MQLEMQLKKFENECQKVEHTRLRNLAKIQARARELIREIERQAAEQSRQVDRNCAQLQDKLASRKSKIALDTKKLQ